MVAFALIVDGHVGNTILEVFDINFNLITSKGLADITRLLESTQLKTIHIAGNQNVFNDEAFHPTLCLDTYNIKSQSVQELLSWIDEYDFPADSRAASYAIIKNSSTRNQQLNRVNLLLAPLPQQQQQQQRNAGTMMLKTWHMAITKFSMVPNNAGASAIFKLFTARPQLLEKRLKRPTTTTAADTVSQQEQCKLRRL